MKIKAKTFCSLVHYSLVPFESRECKPDVRVQMTLLYLGQWLLIFDFLVLNVFLLETHKRGV